MSETPSNVPGEKPNPELDAPEEFGAEQPEPEAPGPAAVSAEEPTLETSGAPEFDAEVLEAGEVDPEVTTTEVVSDPEATIEAESDPGQPADQPIPDELISPELAPRLTLDEVEPEPPAAPDLEAVTTEPPAAPVTPPAAPSLDLPGVDYAEHSARVAYGQAASEPSPPVPPAPTPPSDPYATSPYAGQPPYGGQAPYTSQAAYAEPQYGQQPGQSQFNQPQFGQPAGYPPVPYQQQLNPTDEGTWATAAHWSAILASFIGLGFLGPLLVLLIQGPKSARVRANAVESLNFEITYVIGMIASVLLMLVFIGFVTIIVLPILWLILRIVASVQTSGGRDYRYPLNIRLVK